MSLANRQEHRKRPLPLSTLPEKRVLLRLRALHVGEAVTPHNPKYRKIDEENELGGY